MCGYIDQSNFPFLNIVSQKMISHFYVLGLEWSTGFLAMLMALVAGTRGMPKEVAVGGWWPGPKLPMATVAGCRAAAGVSREQRKRERLD
jgi:hypothetical protein